MNDLVEFKPIDFNKPLTMTHEEIRHFMTHVEAEMRKYPEVEVPLKHYFSPGCYGREVLLKRNTLAMGKIHRFACLTIISAGEVTILSIDGAVRVKAPYTFVSTPGAKRLVYAHEDSVWTTVQATEETDIAKIENHFVAEDYDQVELQGEKCLT